MTDNRYVHISACALLAVSFFFLIDFFEYLVDNKAGNVREDAVVYVYPDSDAEAVFVDICRKASVKRPRSLGRAFKNKEVSSNMEPGRYEIKKGFSSVYIARMLNNCWQSPGKLVLSGSLRSYGQIASKISSQMMVDSLTVIKALSDTALLSRYGVTPQTAYSLFIPDTYEFFWTDGIEEILAKMKDSYDSFWNTERKAKAAALGLSPMQVVTLASIVKGETNLVSDMPKIAGVYLRRLKIGMRLQADPTVAFCYDYSPSRILKVHLKVDSPYNTYKYKGLPPGPISSPGKECLDAVLNPEGKYLYFCADPSFDGSHRFATSYSEHLRNAREFQRALNRRVSPAK